MQRAANDRSDPAVTVTALLDELTRRNVRLRVDGDRLVVDAPTGAIDAGLSARIKATKPDLIEYLANFGLESGASASVSPIAYSDAATGTVSISQERMWMTQQLRPGAADNNLFGAWWLKGALNVESLERALQDLIDRHSLLRAHFIERESKVTLVTLPTRPQDLRIEDLSSLAGDAIDAELRTALECWAKEPFDLMQDDLLRVYLVKVARDQHVLCVVSHAIIWDAWSYDVMFEDLAAFYRAHEHGTRAEVEPLGIRFDDYAAWGRRQFEESAAARDLAQYVDRLQPALRRLDLPRKRGATTVDHAGARFNFSLDRSLGDALFGFAKANGLTPFIVVLAAYLFVLGSHARARSVCVTVPLRARDQPELERLIGTFTNHVFVVVNLPPAASFFELCLEVRDAVFDGFARVATPVEAVLQRIDADLARTSLFQVGFSHQNVGSRVVDWGAVSVEPGPVTDFHTSHADINFWLLEYRHALVGAIDYRSKSFDRWQIEAIYEQVCETLRRGTTFPDRALRLHHLWSDSAVRAVARWREGPRVSAGENLKLAIGNDQRAAHRVTTLADLRGMFDGECSRVEIVDIRDTRERDAPLAGMVGFLSQIDGRVDLSVTQFTAAVRAQARDLGFQPDERVLVCGVLAEPSVFVSCVAAIDVGADLSFADPRFVDEFELLKLIDDGRPDVVVLPYSRALALVELGLTQERLARRRVVVQASSPNESRLDHLASMWGRSLTVRTGPEACLQMGLVGRWCEFGLTFRPGCSVSCRIEESGHALGVGMRGDLVVETPWGNSSPASDWRAKWASNGSIRFEEENLQSAATTRIAQALTGLAGVREVCVRDVDTNGYPTPMVWTECEADVGVAQLRNRLRASLPDRFVPRLIVCTPALPRTPDCGVDVDRLPNPFQATRRMRFEPPGTELEISIAAIWRGCLGIANVGANDVFPEIGGTSLMALKVIADMQNVVQQRIEPRLLFFQSLRQIARSIERSKRGTAP